MLLSFSLENWMSFKGKTSFSMVATKERQHGERIPKVDKYQTRILPVAAIYGGNASGKTNLFKALNFAKYLIVKGTQPDSLIQVEPFRLDATGTEFPTRLGFEILVDDTIYAYSFTVSRKTVLEEKLVLISSTSEKVLFDRRGDKPNFDKSLQDDQFLEFAFRGTRDNQLFLTNSVSQKVENFRPVYNWFKESLELIGPDSRFEPFEQFLDEGNPLFSTMNEVLKQLDTGIIHLGSEVVPFENVPLNSSLKTRIQEEVKEGMTVRLMSEPMNERYIIRRTNGELVAKKLVAFHPKSDGTEVRFEIKDEADGSQRVIDLLPAFLDISITNAKKVFVIDEVDRSLHTLLTRQLLEIYLASCSAESRAQLLITTDEMWVTERDSSGISTMVSFSEFKDVRYDKDIRKSYLQGRLGGIPRIFVKGPLP
ncbi:MAG: ATP-binding protein [Bacteroidia bacterium]|nr:ATP-binding protein [Bacteroidia bacterium]